MQNPSGKLPLNDIRVVILDLDGTMIDSVPDLDVALNGMLQELALPPVEVSAIRMFVGRGTQNLVRSTLSVHLESDEVGKTVGYCHDAVLQTLTESSMENAVRFSRVSGKDWNR